MNIGVHSSDRVYLGSEFEELAEALARLLDVPAQPERGREPQMDIPQPRVFGARLSEKRYRFIGVAEQQMARAHTRVEVHDVLVTRTELKRLFAIRQGGFWLPEPVKCVAELQHRGGIVAVERDRLFQRDLRLKQPIETPAQKHTI